MEILEYQDRLYEINVLGSLDEDALVLECADMAADGGLLLTVIRTDEGGLILRPTGRVIPLGLVQLVEAVAERELPKSAGGDHG